MEQENYDTIYNEPSVVISVSLYSEEHMNSKERQILRDKVAEANGEKLDKLIEALAELQEEVKKALKGKK